MAATGTTSSRPEQRGFFGHPAGLSPLFFTEFWERVSYYGMRAILLYYMYDGLDQGGLGLDEGLASSLMSVYGSMVFMSGVLGGWIADRLLGSRRSILHGAILILLGHVCLSLPGGGVGALYGSIVLIVLGTGMLKPNISKVVGDLYDEGDNRRDAGFSLFYMGINLGAFVAPFAVSGMRSIGGYHAGFAVAAIGMALGIAWYVLGGRRLGGAGSAPGNPLTPAERSRLWPRLGGLLLVLVAAVVLLAVTGLLTIEFVINAISVLGVVLSVGYFTVMLRSRKTSAVERSRLRAYIPLFVAAVLFWIILEQGSVILARFADQRTDLDAFGVTIDPALFQSIGPVAIVILAPVFAWIWTKLGPRQPSTPRKLAAGLVFAGLSYLIMALPGLLGGTDALASPLWLVVSLVVVTAGELCLSPVGLSATTKLAPAAFGAQMMSLWFLADAAGQGISAQVVRLYSADTEIAYFGVIGAVVAACGGLLYFLAPVILRQMKGVS
ncbi:peptide MFS transporter [Saccharopolyspora sp. 5N708]|uniref:peptide MFS transporter n=1 Tax=Saccharopolyspora sp. 5N708 TaxID=3457424 RepID=UPI003FD3F110